MSNQPTRSRSNRRSGKLDLVRHWIPVLCRAVAVLVVAIPAVAKLARHAEWVARFDGWGIPLPEVAVPVVGVLQIGAMLLLLFGIAGRVAAGVLAGIMAVAILTAGPDPMNAAVLGSSAVIVVLGTGPCSYWDPQFSDLVERVRAPSGVNEFLSS